jgi:hypothetical protein
MATYPNLDIVNGQSSYTTSFTGTFAGTALAASLTGLVGATLKNGTVTLNLPAITNALAGAGAASLITMTGLPASFWPAAEAYAYPAVVSNAATAVGRVTITAAGVVTFAADIVGTGTFNNAAAAKGIYKQTVQYSALA